MPLSHLTHLNFMRKLSIQPEESTDLDEEPHENPPDIHLEGNGLVDDLDDLPLLPCTGRGQTSGNEDEGRKFSFASMTAHFQDDGRKFSIASMTSIRSSSSISSTCSAPGLISCSVGKPAGNFPPLSSQSESLDVKPMTRRSMTSRPSFISLCSIVSETSEAPRRLLPTPLQVELDLMQRNGVEGDEPKCRSHLPILRCPSDYDITELDMGTSETGQLFRKNSKKGLVKGIKDLPKRMRKMSTEKNRFDVYSISDETRAQLKQLYVY